MPQPLRYTWAVLGFSFTILGSLAANAQVFKTNAPESSTILAADGTPQLVRLSATSNRSSSKQRPDAREVLREQLQLTSADEMRPVRTETDEQGNQHERFQQYYQGIKVEHAVYTVHRQGAGAATSLSGEVKRVSAGLQVRPSLSEAAALKTLLRHIGAQSYMWEDAGQEQALRTQTGNAKATYHPQGELVLVQDYRQAATGRPLVLAWKFNVYARQPESRAWYYVDARTGGVVFTDHIIKHTAATGTLATRYSGSRTSTTDLNNSQYRLRDLTRGAGIVTLNMHKGSNYASAVDFTDADNNWSAAKYNNADMDNAALDVHWATQQVYDYWLSVHNRNSYDGRGTQLLSYVHYDDTPGDGIGYENANWNGTAMRYGDGASVYHPLTSLDICSHELGHGLCQETAGLVYQDESGALNEGFSDIWGACVEQHVAPNKQTWLIGEELVKYGTAMRSMSNPTSLNQPATYKGPKWYSGTGDYGGVHTNSGVLNHWFYILSVGKTGINERGQAYAVTGIGLATAARIAYRAERLYLTPNSDYRSARVFTLQAAADLFGENSSQYEAVANSWYAVGLGAPANYSGSSDVLCLPNDAASLTALASATQVCGGSSITLTAAATPPVNRTLRLTTTTTLPDNAATGAYTSMVVSQPSATVQRGLDALYRSLGDLVSVRVRLRHTQPQQVSLRLYANGGDIANLATPLPRYNGSGEAVWDLTFSDAAALTLPNASNNSTLTGTYKPAVALSTLANVFVATGVAVQARDGVAGQTGSIELVELTFRRATDDVPTLRWTGPGIDQVGAIATFTPPTPSGPANYRYTVAATDPYFGCTTTHDVVVQITGSVLEARASVSELSGSANKPLPAFQLVVTSNDSIAGQVYSWTGAHGYSATGLRRTVQPATGGRLVYNVQTTRPGTSCATERRVVVTARRLTLQTADSVVCPGSAIRLHGGLQNELAGPYRYTGSTAIPDNNTAGVRIPLTVSGTAEGFFDLRGVQVNIAHTWIGDLELYLEAPDGTRVLLSKQNGLDGDFYRNTVFVDSVGATSLSSGASPYAGAWHVQDAAGFSALRSVRLTGTWNLWVRDLGAADVGQVLGWALVTTPAELTWRGPAGFVAAGGNLQAAAPATPGLYTYVLQGRSGSAQLQDTLRVRVTNGPEWRVRASARLSDVANWSCMPNSSTDAEVRGTSNMPAQLISGVLQVHNLVVRAGTTLRLDGGTLEVFGNLTLEAGAQLLGTNGTLVLRGASTRVLADAGALQVPNLRISLPTATDTVVLKQNMAVAQALEVQQGLLNTNSYIVDLAATAQLTESNGYVLGSVRNTQSLAGAGSSSAFSGLGVVLTASGSTGQFPGNTTVTRVTGQVLALGTTNHCIRRYYSINAQNNQGLDVTLRFYYREADLAPGIAEADLQVYKAAALNSTWQKAGSSSRSGNSKYVELASNSSLGFFTLGAAAVAPLPVELVSFEAKRLNREVALTWQTAQEHNNRGFGVETSLDGKEWRRLTFVPGVLTGNSTTPQAYRYIDAEAFSPTKTRYYRLRQEDFNGTAHYSPVRSVVFDDTAMLPSLLSVFPNPVEAGARTLLELQSQAPQELELQVFDALGRLVLHRTAAAVAGSAKVEWPELKLLPAGRYVVRAKIDGNLRTASFVRLP